MKLSKVLLALGTLIAFSIVGPAQPVQAQSHGSHGSTHSNHVLVVPFVCSGGGTARWVSQGASFILNANSTSNAVGGEFENVSGGPLNNLSFVLSTACDPNTGPIVAFNLTGGGFKCVSCTQAFQQSLGGGRIKYSFNQSQLGVSPGVTISSLFVAFYPSSTNKVSNFVLNNTPISQDLSHTSTDCPPECDPDNEE